MRRWHPSRLLVASQLGRSVLAWRSWLFPGRDAGTWADPGCYPSRSRRWHLDGRQLHGFLVSPGMRRQHLDGRQRRGSADRGRSWAPVEGFMVASKLGWLALALQVATLDGWAGGCLPRRSWLIPGRDDHADIIPAPGLDNLGGFLQLLARVF